MTADALATAFMVMGLEEAETFCKANPKIDAYFIYSGDNGEFKTYYTEGMNSPIKRQRKYTNKLEALFYANRASIYIKQTLCLGKTEPLIFKHSYRI